MNRRSLLTGSAAFVAGALSSKYIVALQSSQKLPIPELIEVDGGNGNTLEAIESTTQILPNFMTPTMGYSRSYLGPTLRFKRGHTSKLQVFNKTNDPVTTHWHGLHVPGNMDGGPQLAIAPGGSWSPELEIDQPAATLWYHSHVHGFTADQVMAGLSGMIIIDDPDDTSMQLPMNYGVDDIPLIIQDRAFNGDGSFFYEKRGPLLMHGFRAGQMLVNGALTPRHAVPKGLVRLRLLNASNARIYTFNFSDKRSFYQIASDGGLLPKPLKKSSVQLSPAERVEILVDFSDGKPVELLSSPDINFAGMGRRMFGDVLDTTPVNEQGDFLIMSFEVDPSKQADIKTVPKKLEAAAVPEFDEPVRRRQFELNMHVSGGMGMGGMMGGGSVMGIMGINGQSMDMERIDEEVRLGETEIWEVFSDEMAHPFHIHGTSFQVLSDNGQPVDFGSTGMKDVHLVTGRSELLVKFDKKADAKTPYMFHCHILEHEDAGMMGQFTVS